MGIGLIAVAGVLLLGAGVMILVVNLEQVPWLLRDDRPDPDVRLRRRDDRRLGDGICCAPSDRLDREPRRRLGGTSLGTLR